MPEVMIFLKQLCLTGHCVVAYSQTLFVPLVSCN